MRSESWTFIWQPKVSIRYFFAISVRLAGFRLSPRRRKHLGRRRADGVGDGRSSYHPRDFVHAPGRVEPVHRRDRPGPPNGFFDPELRRAPRGNLRQVRDAEDLEAAAQRLEACADDFRHSPADPGID